MNTVGRIWKNLVEQKSILIMTALMFVIGGFSVFLGLAHPAILFDEAKIGLFYTTGIQVVSGLLGLIFAGFTFLKAELDRKLTIDPSLEQIVNAVLSRNSSFLVYLVIVGGLAIGYSWLVISISDNVRLFDSTRTYMNIAGTLIAVEISSMLYFIVVVSDSETLITTAKRLSAKNNKKIGGAVTPSQEFLGNVNKIVEMLEKYNKDTNSINYVADGKTSSIGTFSLDKVVEQLVGPQMLTPVEVVNLKSVVAQRNLLIHARMGVVSNMFVQQSTELVKAVEGAVNIKMATK